MRYTKTKLLVKIIMIVSLCVIFSTNVLSDPIVDEITIDPTNPTPLSNVTFTAVITGINISKVNLTVIECSEIACFSYGEYPMSRDAYGNWFVEAKLQDDTSKATFFKYEFEVVDDGVTYLLENETWKVDILVDAENGDEDSNAVPGFEFVVLLFATLIGILIFNRKRLK